MTAEAVEDGQADAAGPSPRVKHLAEWVEAMAGADKLLRQVIADELAEGIPALQQAQAKAAAALQEAYAALEGPERDLAGIDGEIAAAASELATWRERIETGDVAARVKARRWADEWEAELTALRQKREFAEARILPLRDAQGKARAALEQATTALQVREMNATPELAYFAAGQDTAAYGFRFGMGLEAALRDRDHYEHGAAIGYMLHLCQVSGFRTEDYAGELPSDAEAARRFWDDVYANASPAQVPLTGAEVVAEVHAEMTVAAANKAASRSVIEDYTRPAPPRPVIQRDYMTVPRVPDQYRAR